MADSPQDEVYEVEKILGHKFVKKGKVNDSDLCQSLPNVHILVEIRHHILYQMAQL
jgi:hypothetical protein